MHLFQDQLALKVFARSYARPRGSLAEAMALLHLLQRRRNEGFLDTLSETRIEQSFNERLFAELFGYRTLLRDGSGHYHLQPKTYHEESRRYDDFSLGFYGPTGGKAVVSCELKSPFTDLDKPQLTGNYRDLTPVEQAMTAVAPVSSVKWVIVSNFEEMRLYRAGNSTRYEQVFLTDVHSAADLQRLLALFSKRTLLGDEDELVTPQTRNTSRDSLLEQLYNGSLEHMVPPIDGRIRLVQHMIPHNQDQVELPFHRLEDAVRRDRVLNSFDFDGPHVINDRLIFTYRSQPGDHHMEVEATKNGVLQYSLYIDDGHGITIPFMGWVLQDRIKKFLQWGRTFYTTLQLGAVRAAWYLDGIGGACCRAEPSWCPSHLPIPELTAPPTIQGSQMTIDQLPLTSDEEPNPKLSSLVAAIVRELLYPFSIIDPHTNRMIRAHPSGYPGQPG